MKADMTIGELAGELQLNPKTIRYYEEVGLLPEPRRSESGYRLYSKHEVERLQLIQRAKLIGLSLAEIKEIVEYAVDRRCGVTEVRLLSLVEEKLGEIDRKIDDLITLRDNLRQYHRDLSSRTPSGSGQGTTAATLCQCLGEEAESLGKQNSIYLDKPFPGPGKGYPKRKEETTMVNKAKKEPKATAPKTECGCGCLPVKK